MNIQDIFYHGIRDQVRRVLGAMTPEQIDQGLTAFDNGQSSWSHCFFARAFRGTADLDARGVSPEQELMKLLGLKTVIPIRIVYCTFDGLGVTMTKDQLREFVRSVRAGEVHAATLDALRKVDYAGAADREAVQCPA